MTKHRPPDQTNASALARDDVSSSIDDRDGRSVTHPYRDERAAEAARRDATREELQRLSAHARARHLAFERALLALDDAALDGAARDGTEGDAGIITDGIGLEPSRGGRRGQSRRSRPLLYLATRAALVVGAGCVLGAVVASWVLGGMESRLRSAGEVTQARLPASPAPTTSLTIVADAPRGLSHCLASETLRSEGVERIGAQEWCVVRGVLSRGLGPEVRTIMHTQDGQLQGVKVYGLGRTSHSGRLGLQNGDLLRSINGIDLGDPERALAAYQGALDADSLLVEVERRGARRLHIYRLVN